ncbi:hypothetical protein GCM10008929_01950 [Alkalibacterium psychrotolerans]
MTEKSKQFIIILIAHYFIFRFYFNFVSTAIQQIIVFGILGLYIIINLKSVNELFLNIGKHKTLFILGNIFYILAVLLSFFTPLLYKTYDFTYFSVHVRYLSYLITYVVLLDLIKRWLGRARMKENFLRIFIITARNYVLVSILMLVIPQIREFWISIILESPRGLALIRNNPAYVARFGWAGYSGFTVTFMMTLAVAFTIYFIVKDINTTQPIKKMDLLNMILLLLGNAFYGRSGLLSSIAIIGISVLYIMVKNRKIQMAFSFVGLLILLFFILTVLSEYNDTLAEWYSWVVTPIQNLVTTGSFNVGSTDHLWSMYFVPELRTLLLGDGFYTNLQTGTYYMRVDVGFLRPVLFGGLPQLIISYLVPLIMTIGVGLMRKENRFLAFLIILTLFIFEVKGEVVIPLIPPMYSLFLSEAATEKSAAYKGKKSLLISSQPKLGMRNI